MLTWGLYYLTSGIDSGIEGAPEPIPESATGMAKTVAITARKISWSCMISAFRFDERE